MRLAMGDWHSLKVDLEASALRTPCLPAPLALDPLILYIGELIYFYQ